MPWNDTSAIKNARDLAWLNPSAAAQPHECVAYQLPAARVEEGLAGVVAGELPGLGDKLRGTHGETSSGTQTVTAAGSTRILSRFVGGRSPPSTS